MREFTKIESIGQDQYEVITTKTNKKGKIKKDTYFVDLRIHYCTCRSWFFNKYCPHIREIITQLRSGGHIIVWNKKEQAHYDLGLK